MRCILQNPQQPKEVIIGTPIGVWQTLNFTNTTPQWRQLGQGINTISVVDLDLRTSDNLVLATTHGRGFFTTQFLKSYDTVRNDDQPNHITVFPTFPKGKVNFVSNKDFGKTSVAIYALTGQKVIDQNIELHQKIKASIDLQLSSGVYLIKINTKNHQFIKRIVVK